VANDLKVKLSGAPQDYSDNARAIAHVLEWHAQVPDGKVHAWLSDRWVTLGGDVEYALAACGGRSSGPKPRLRPWARHRWPGPPSCRDGAARIISPYTVAFHLREVFLQARHQVARRPGRIALEHARSKAAQTPRLGDVREAAWR